MKRGTRDVFPIDISSFKHQKFSLDKKKLSQKELQALRDNVNLCRDAIIFFTAYAGAKGLGGHTGGPYDIVPEALIFDALMNEKKNKIVPILFDSAGHRVALQYLMAALKGKVKPERLLHYREHKHGFYGHPERDEKLGIHFSSGRLGHLWSYVNGVALANPDKKVVVLSSDGSMQEGGEDEAAKFAVAHDIDVTVSIDMNNVTISGHPSEYMHGYHIEEMLQGHGVSTSKGNPEHLQHLYQRIRAALLHDGPSALINTRKMALGIHGLENNPKAHDVLKPANAIHYLDRKGHDEAAHMIVNAKKKSHLLEFKGSSIETKKNRAEFGNAVNKMLSKMSKKARVEKIKVIDSDLAGSTGLNKIHDKYPEVFLQGGIMERNNFSVAAGFGMQKGKQGIMSTFSAFLEMVISELTMARLNESTMLCHFSHAGVDWMADSNCHYGVNNFFADNGFWNDSTRLYYPADTHQLHSLVKRVFWDKGIRFIFTTRSPTPMIFDAKGKELFKGRKFFPGKDDLVRSGKDGVIVAYGEMLCRAVHVAEVLRKKGVKIAVVNKSTLNVVDEAMMKKLLGMPFVLVVESQNERTGLGSRFGTWLLERGFSGKYAHMGTNRLGAGGITEQLPWQGLDVKNIEKKVRSLLVKKKRGRKK